MVTSTYRTLIIVLFLDIFIGAVIMFSTNAEIESIYNEVSKKIDTNDQWVSNVSERMNNPTDDANRLQLNPQYGDAKSTGKAVWEIMTTEIGNTIYGKCSDRECNYSYAGWIWLGLGIIFTIAHIIAIMELYFIFFNKKTS